MPTTVWVALFASRASPLMFCGPRQSRHVSRFARTPVCECAKGRSRSADRSLEDSRIPRHRKSGERRPSACSEEQPAPQNRSTITIEGPGVKNESNRPAPAFQVLPNSTVKPANTVGDRRGMSERKFAIVRGSYPGRKFCFLKPLDDPKNTVFFSAFYALDKDRNYANGELVVYEVGTDSQGRSTASNVRRAQPDDVAHLRRTAWVLDYDASRNAGRLAVADGRY